MRCIECGEQMDKCGELPLEFPAGVDQRPVFVCLNMGCNRYGLLTIAAR